MARNKTVEANSLPFSQAAENNKDAILQVLRNRLKPTQQVLEIGSGTGQHGVWFARHLPHITWQCADQRYYHEGILARIEQSGLNNIHPPLSLDVMDFHWSAHQFDSVFSANTAHIMSWQMVTAMFTGVSTLLGEGEFLLYGPFNRNGEYTSEGNRQFDESLRAQNPEMGIRDDTEIIKLASDHGLTLQADIQMPANNRLLVFAKQAAG